MLENTSHGELSSGPPPVSQPSPNDLQEIYNIANRQTTPVVSLEDRNAGERKALRATGTLAIQEASCSGVNTPGSCALNLRWCQNTEFGQA